jgi:hypothetical protein
MNVTQRQDRHNGLQLCQVLVQQVLQVLVNSVHMQHYQDWSICVFRDPLFLQIAPLVVIVVFLVVGLFVASQVRRTNLDKVTYNFLKFFAMVLDSFGITLPWLWGTPQRASSTSSSRSRRHRRKSSSSKSKLVRTRAEQIALQNTSKNPTDGENAPYCIHVSNVLFGSR